MRIIVPRSKVRIDSPTDDESMKVSIFGFFPSVSSLPSPPSFLLRYRVKYQASKRRDAVLRKKFPIE